MQLPDHRRIVHREERANRARPNVNGRRKPAHPEEMLQHPANPKPRHGSQHVGLHYAWLMTILALPPRRPDDLPKIMGWSADDTKYWAFTCVPSAETSARGERGVPVQRLASALQPKRELQNE